QHERGPAAHRGAACALPGPLHRGAVDQHHHRLRRRPLGQQAPAGDEAHERRRARRHVPRLEATTFPSRTPMAVSDLLYTPVRDLAAQLKSKKLTSVQLTQTCLDRLDTLGPKLNAVVTLMKESAMAEARAADAEISKGRHRGALHGIPYGVKDLLATK